MPRMVNTHMDDSDTEILNYLQDKIDHYWRVIDRIREKNDPNDSYLLSFYTTKLVRLSNIIHHMKYN